MAWTKVEADPSGFRGEYWIDEDGRTSNTDPALYKPQVNDYLARLVAAHGGSALDPNTNLQSLWTGRERGYVNDKGQVLYNGGDSANQYWVNQGDPAFIAAPKHNDGFFQKDAYDPRALISEMPGLPLLLAPLAGFAAGGGAAAGGDAALAGGGEVGSGYAASAPGWGAAESASAGASVAPAAQGTTSATNTTGSNTMFDDYGNPLDMGSSTATSTNVGDPNATGAFDQSGSQGVFDANGNPTYTSPTDYGGMLKQAQDLAAKAGITPAAALKYLAGLVTKGAPAALGAYAANQQANSLKDLADKYMNLGAPSRDRYEASFAPGFTMANDPGYTDALDQASKASMHALSVNGNPVGSPNAWGRSMQDLYEKTAYPALQTFRNQNASTGGIASFSAAAPGAATGAINAEGNVFNAVGAGVNDIFNPKPSLAQTLADYKRLMATGG